MNTTSSELEAARSSAPHAWIETYTGRKFWPLAPSPDDIDIFDIAQALSMTCRYKGHTNEFYSVAEHSVLLAEKLPPHLRLRGLLHDAHEAYSPFGDVPRPLKSARPEIAAMVKEAEGNLDAAIAARFGLSLPIADWLVKEYDTRILHDERRQLMSRTGFEWALPDMRPLGVVCRRWAPFTAREFFLMAFDEAVKSARMTEAG